MLKKIALVAAVAASASFATYNFFPVGNVHTGQAEVGLQYGWTDNSSNFEMMLGGEFVVIDKLELSLFNIGYQFWNDPDDCGEKGHPDCSDKDGIKAMTFGARYQVTPILGVALDINLPFSSEDVVSKYDPFGMYAAAQFSMEFIPGLALGSEAGLSYKFEDENVTEGLGLTIKAELDYTIASIGLTPWIGAEFDMRISDIKEEYKKGKDKYTHEYGSGDNAFTIWVGAAYKINEMFTVKANFISKFADEDETMGVDWNGVNAKLDINF